MTERGPGRSTLCFGEFGPLIPLHVSSRNEPETRSGSAAADESGCPFRRKTQFQLQSIDGMGGGGIR